MNVQLRERNATVETVLIGEATPADKRPSTLPNWAAPALRSRPSWPELDHRFVVGVAAAGVSGWFGPVSAATACIIRDQVAPGLIGRSVMSFRPHVSDSAAGRHRTGSHFAIAASAVDLALWDLRSRIADEPIPALLGGVTRTVVPVYASALGFELNHHLASDIALWISEEGFWGQKWAVPYDGRADVTASYVRALSRIRSAVGDDTRLMVDARGTWSEAFLKRIGPAMRELDIAWIEEPLRDDRLTHIPLGGSYPPIAAGEHAYDVAQQIALLTSGRVQIWQPDVAWQGGLAQSLRLIDLASDLGIPSFPHGSGLSVGAIAGALTSASSVPAIEFHLTLEPLRQQLVADPLTPTNGLIFVRPTSGLADAAHPITWFENESAIRRVV
jgi:L-rhamnonate dehydratase